MNVVSVFEVLNIEILCYLMFFLFSSLLKRKLSISISMLSFMLLNFIIYMFCCFFSYSIFLQISLFFLVSILFIFIFTNNNLISKVFVASILLVTIMISIVIASSIYFAILKKSIIFADYKGGRIIYIIFINTIFFLISLLFIFAWKSTKEKVKMKSLMLFVVFPISQVSLLFGIFFSGIFATNETLICIATVGVALSILADYIMIKAIDILSNRYLIDEKLILVENLRATELDYFNLMQHHFSELNVVRHDAKNQLQIAQSLLASPEFTDKTAAIELLEFFSQSNENTVGEKYCENSVVNTVLIVKSNLAETYNIKVKIKVNVPEKLSIEKIDLCSVFCNLIDNAIDACSTIYDEGINKRISVKANIISGYLVIKIENTKQNRIIEEGDTFITTKTSKGHGYGLQIVKNIALKCDGDILVKHDAQNFIATVTLKAYGMK